MTRRPSSSRVGPRDEATHLKGVLHDMIESHQQQTAFMRDGLISVQQTTTVAMERAVAPREPKLGNVLDFKSLQLETFVGTEKPLDAKQWLVDMTNLLNAARVPKDDQVKVIKIKL